MSLGDGGGPRPRPAPPGHGATEPRAATAIRHPRDHPIKAFAKRHWPRLRLRTILFATLMMVAALPGVAAMFLRVYENTLVRQTEAELVAQGAALAATAQALWPVAVIPSNRRPGLDPGPRSFADSGRGSGTPAQGRGDGTGGEDLTIAAAYPGATAIDLSRTPILAARPAPAGPRAMPAPGAAAALARLAPIIARTRADTGAAILLLDAGGRLIDGADAGLSWAALPEVRAALAGTPATVLRRYARYQPVYYFEWLSRAAGIRVHHARPVIVDGRVVGVLLLARSAHNLFDGLYADRGKIAFGVVAILILLVFLSGLLSRGVTRPIERLGAATRAVAAGRGAVPEVPPTAAIEIQGLYADFAAMAAAIERRSRYLRDVAHAVSHEFKTPLAGIRGALELIADHPDMAPADRARFLANAGADAQRLALLVTRLLDLARADMAGADGAALPAPVLARVADAQQRGGFTVTIDAPAPAPLPEVAVAGTAIEAVLITLLDNSRQAGATAATLTAAVETDAVVLTLVDNGPGIAPGDAARLFEPFFTTRRAIGGTGLGLAIARSLIAGAGGEIALAAAQPASFRIALPRTGSS